MSALSKLPQEKRLFVLNIASTLALLTMAVKHMIIGYLVGSLLSWDLNPVDWRWWSYVIVSVYLFRKLRALVWIMDMVYTRERESYVEQGNKDVRSRY